MREGGKKRRKRREGGRRQSKLAWVTGGRRIYHQTEAGCVADRARSKTYRSREFRF